VLRIEVADAHAQRQQLGVGELRGAAQFGQAPLEHLARRLRFAEVTSQRLDIVLGRRRRGRRLRPCFGRRDPCIGEQGCQVGESLLECFALGRAVRQLRSEGVALADGLARGIDLAQQPLAHHLRLGELALELRRAIRLRLGVGLQLREVALQQFRRDLRLHHAAFQLVLVQRELVHLPLRLVQLVLQLLQLCLRLGSRALRFAARALDVGQRVLQHGDQFLLLGQLCLQPRALAACLGAQLHERLLGEPRRFLRLRQAVVPGGALGGEAHFPRCLVRGALLLQRGQFGAHLSNVLARRVAGAEAAKGCRHELGCEREELPVSRTWRSGLRQEGGDRAEQLAGGVDDRVRPLGADAVQQGQLAPALPMGFPPEIGRHDELLVARGGHGRARAVGQGQGLERAAEPVGEGGAGHPDERVVRGVQQVNGRLQVHT
jgi:hypothetical protein